MKCLESCVSFRFSFMVIFIDDFDIGFADDTCFYGLYIDFDTSLKATIENELSKLDLEACGEDYTFEYKIR